MITPVTPEKSLLAEHKYILSNFPLMEIDLKLWSCRKIQYFRDPYSQLAVQDSYQAQGRKTDIFF